MSSFTCVACGGFKYNQAGVLIDDDFEHDRHICQDCYENGALAVLSPPQNFGITGTSKPGLMEVLLACWEEEWKIDGNSFLSWLTLNGGAERTAEELQKFCKDIWKRNYLKITGEEWK